MFAESARRIFSHLPSSFTISRIPIIPLLIGALLVSGCAGNLTARPDVYQANKTRIEHPNYALNPVLVKPVAPKGSPVLVVFASGDSGLTGLSKTILQHLADDGYYAAGFSSREALRAIKGAREKVPYAEAIDQLSWMTSEAKSKLGLPPETPMIVTGLSRGANMVILAATSKMMQKNITGAVAIALTRELDNLSLPDTAMAMPGIEVDEQQRPQTYPAIRHMGAIPLAIIQSTRDKYVPSAESRKLLGPDTPTRRLYEVKANGHSFGGGQNQMLKDLDDAMNWIIKHT
jgi:dienelactone hydrolase